MREIPSWDDYFLEMLEIVRKRSPDAQTQVATILVDNNRVISMGYNGWPTGIDGLPDTRPDKYKWMIHGEINAIVNAKGKDPKNPVCYITGTPCERCNKAMWNFGVRKIVSLNQPFASLTDDDFEVLGTLIINGLEFSIKDRIDISKHSYIFDRSRLHTIEGRKYIIERTKEFVAPTLAT